MRVITDERTASTLAAVFQLEPARTCTPGRDRHKRSEANAQLNGWLEPGGLVRQSTLMRQDNFSPQAHGEAFAKRAMLATSLNKYRALGIEPTCIVDIGAGIDTPALRNTFPNIHHHLFEPNDSHLVQLAANYRDVPHTIYPVAIGGRPWGIDYFFSDKEELPEGLLLKIDVDGPDLAIMQASPRTISKAVLIIIEAPLHALAERATFLQAHGFELVDIVDLSYCRDQLWQVDLVFAPWAKVNYAPFQSPRREEVKISEWVTLGYD